MTSPLSTERLRDLMAASPLWNVTVAQVQEMARELLLLRERSAVAETKPCTDPQHEAAVALAEEALLHWDEQARRDGGEVKSLFRKDRARDAVAAYRAARQPQREEEPVLSAEAIAKLHGIGDKMDDTGYLARVLLIMASDLQRALRRAQGDAP